MKRKTVYGKKTINIDTLSINATKTASRRNELENSSIVITNPNKVRKKETEISR